MKLTFVEHNDLIQSTFEESSKYANFQKLCVDTYRKNPVGITLAEANDKIREKIRMMAGLTEDATPKQIKKAFRKSF